MGAREWFNRLIKWSRVEPQEPIAPLRVSEAAECPAESEIYGAPLKGAEDDDETGVSDAGAQ